MNEQAAQPTFGQALARLYRPPYLGLLAFAGVLLWKPVAHSTSVLLAHNFPGNPGYLAGGLIGLLGCVLVWNGLKKNEHIATCLGFVGGVMIWLGWMEYAFTFFAAYMNVPMLLNPDGTRAVGPNLRVLQSTAVPVLTVLYLILIANKESRCRLAMWIRRNLGLQAGTPVAGYQPGYARITALEVIFVNWFMYLISITINDSRIFGAGHPVQYAVFVSFILWAGYLVAFKLPQIRDMPLAVRYAIGVTGPAWSVIEIASRMRLFTEIWIYPSQYPIPVLAIAAAFIAAATVIVRTPAADRRASKAAA